MRELMALLNLRGKKTKKKPTVKLSNYVTHCSYSMFCKFSCIISDLADSQEIKYFHNVVFD